MRFMKAFILISSITSLLLLSGCPLPEVEAESPGKVIVQIGDGVLTEGDVERALLALPPQIREGIKNSPERRVQLIEMLVARELASMEAESLGWPNETEVMLMLEDGRKQVLYNEWLQREIEIDELTDEIIEAYYEENKAMFTVGEQRDVFLISTVDEASAKKALRRIENGEDFSAVARDMSVSPTAEDGGAMGLVERNDLVREIDDVAFSLAPGEVSDPIQTAFGWHLVMVSKVLEPHIRSLSEVKPHISQQAKAWEQRRRYEERIEDLKEKYGVEVVGAQEAPSVDLIPGAPGSGPPGN